MEILYYQTHLQIKSSIYGHDDNIQSIHSTGIDHSIRQGQKSKREKSFTIQIFPLTVPSYPSVRPRRHNQTAAIILQSGISTALCSSQLDAAKYLPKIYPIKNPKPAQASWAYSPSLT